jgi:hypothetical protein
MGEANYLSSVGWSEVFSSAISLILASVSSTERFSFITAWTIPPISLSTFDTGSVWV